jgi:uncharacterized protein (DUF305 family)
MKLQMRLSLFHIHKWICILFLATGLIACSSSEHAASDSSHSSADQHHNHHEMATEHNADQMSEMEALYWARIDSARMNFTQADVDFMVGMIGHHAQALIMSRLAPENGASRSVQTLAARIINAQDDEIFLMQKWLRDRHQAVPEVHIDGLVLDIRMTDPHNEHGHGEHGGHSHHAMHDHSDMPGMLTQEQLEELSVAQGREFDRLFLKYMIEHHDGAVIMVQDLFAVDGAATDREAFELASGIKAEQVTEIERMKLMLEQMGYSYDNY